MSSGECEICGRELMDGSCAEHWASDSYGEAASVELQAREQQVADAAAEGDLERLRRTDPDFAEQEQLAAARFARAQAGLDPDPLFLQEAEALRVLQELRHESSIGQIAPLTIEHVEQDLQSMIGARTTLRIGGLTIEIEYLDADPDEHAQVAVTFDDARAVLTPTNDGSRRTWSIAGDASLEHPTGEAGPDDVDLGF
jgi:hypothetical protein